MATKNMTGRWSAPLVCAVGLLALAGCSHSADQQSNAPPSQGAPAMPPQAQQAEAAAMKQAQQRAAVQAQQAAAKAQNGGH